FMVSLLATGKDGNELSARSACHPCDRPFAWDIWRSSMKVNLALSRPRWRRHFHDAETLIFPLYS
ncbi:MAG: hypothetical protein ABWY12_01970, partial [Burkholderiales bacterium]